MAMLERRTASEPFAAAFAIAVETAINTPDVAISSRIWPNSGAASLVMPGVTLCAPLGETLDETVDETLGEVAS